MMKPAIAAILFLAHGFLARPAQAETIVLDGGCLSIEFEVAGLGIESVRGQFDEVWGTLDLDWIDTSKSRLRVVASAQSVRTQSAFFNVALRSPEFFDVTRYPYVTFESSAVELSGSGTGTVTGSLVIRGATRLVNFPFQLIAEKEPTAARSPVPHLKAIGTVRRSEWGMSALIPVISDTVRLTIRTGC